MINGSNKSPLLKPFLKWAGGKTQLLSEISQKFPNDKNTEFVYFEPFLGSGAVLFWVLNTFPNIKSITVNDLNEDLINTYKIVKSDVESLIQQLQVFQTEYHSLIDLDAKKTFFYNKRALFNSRSCSSTEQAALLIFLNRTCFNGLYRVNKKNEFNVPIGSYKKPMICDEHNLRLVSKALEKVTILCGDFYDVLNSVTSDSMVYLDPPYKPLSQTSSFNTYASVEFNDSEQIRLKLFCDKLTEKGCSWLLSNSDVKGVDGENGFFDELYSDYKITRVMAKRNINSNSSKRGKLTELLIAN